MAYNRWHSSYGSHEPITYVRGFPVDLTTLITAAHITTTVLFAIAFAMGFRGVSEGLFTFSTSAFWQGKVWTIITDPFFHDISSQPIFLALNFFFFFWFGRELERLIGRFNFAILYSALIVIPALACLATAGLFKVNMGVNVPYVSIPAHFAIFVGFAIAFPSVMFFGIISARWFAILLVGIYTLAIIAYPAPITLVPYFAALATVYFYMGFVGAGRNLSILDIWQSWREKQQDQKIQKRKSRIQTVKRVEEASVDAILDKINEHGLHSLTAKERDFLEQKGTQLRAGEGKER